MMTEHTQSDININRLPQFNFVKVFFKLFELVPENLIYNLVIIGSFLF